MQKPRIDIKKDRWSEDEIFALPIGESDKFDRKSRAIFDGTDCERKIAKALSAFANSGGGHLILGIKDDGITADGVSKIRRGKVTTKDWLEQKIPFLVAPLLQNFRVYEVEPADQTQIPRDKVIIVIDIGDSDLAPHQSDQEKMYYYRAAGRSEPAPHRYLELLWQRTNYPGPRIASAWIYKVINFLLNSLEYELKYLADKKWNFRQSHPDSLKDLKMYLNDCSGNYEQFYDYHPEIFKLTQNHDELVTEFIKNLGEHYKAIRSSIAMEGAFQHTTSLESLERLKNEKEFCRLNSRLEECNFVEDFLKTLFYYNETSQILDTLSESAINNWVSVGESNYAPFWSAYKDYFLVLPTLNCGEKTAFEDTRKSLIETINILIEKLRNERNSLCYKYQLPFEESPQIIVQNSRYSPFG